MKALFATALLMTMAVSAPSLADRKAQRARMLFKKAETHFKLGEFARALGFYKEAYRINQLPEFLFNIGQCHRFLDQCDKAVFYFRQFLREKPKGRATKEVKKLLRSCERKLRALERKRRREERERRRLKEKEKEKQEKEKRAAPPSQPASRPLPAAAPAKREPLSSIWFWSAVGLTGALFVTGVLTAAIARAKNKAYLDPETSISRREELRDAGRALEKASWATLGLAAGGVAASVVLYFLSRPRPATEQRATAWAAPAPGGGILAVGGRF